MSADPTLGRTPSVSEVASAYVDGEVGSDQATWVEANRATDAVLSAELDGFARVKALVGGLGMPAPTQAGWDAIGTGVRREIAAQARRSWTARVSAVAAALVLVAAIAVGAVVAGGRPAPDPGPRVTPAVLGPGTTSSGTSRSGTGAVAAARGIGSVVERVGISPRRPASTTSTTSPTRSPYRPVAPSR